MAGDLPGLKAVPLGLVNQTRDLPTTRLFLSTDCPDQISTIRLGCKSGRRETFFSFFADLNVPSFVRVLSSSRIYTMLTRTTRAIYHHSSALFAPSFSESIDILLHPSDHEQHRPTTRNTACSIFHKVPATQKSPSQFATVTGFLTRVSSTFHSAPAPASPSSP